MARDLEKTITPAKLDDFALKLLSAAQNLLEIRQAMQKAGLAEIEAPVGNIRNASDAARDWCNLYRQGLIDRAEHVRDVKFAAAMAHVAVDAAGESPAGATAGAKVVTKKSATSR